MKNLGLLGTVLALSIGLSAVAPGVDAKPKEPKEEETAKDAPAKVPKAPVFKPRGLKFGFSHDKVIKVYDRVIDRDYVPRFQKVEPGVQMERLQHEIRSKKQAFRISYTELDSPPSALDGTPFRDEISYYNGEAFLKIQRDGRQRHLFFIKDKLWKTVDVYPLSERSKWGSSFDSAVERVDKLLGVKGRRLEAEGDRKRKEVDWADGKTHLRLADWGKNKLAVIFVDKRTEARLDDLRSNAGPAKHDITPETKGVLREKKKDEPREGDDEQKKK